MNGTYHKNAKKELKSFQYGLVDTFVKITHNEKDLTEMIEKYPAWQLGKNVILKSDYLKMCIRRKKLKQIQNNLIK
jgi:hypothetical protein